MSDESRFTDVFGVTLRQADVDFVLPNLATDLRIGIDPFLLWKSRDPEYRAVHDALLAAFNYAIDRFSRGDQETAQRIIDFPEVEEIGFGYRQGKAPGTGMGDHLNSLLLATLGESPLLVQRGVRHLEEMQLVTLGIGPDRTSDMAANLLKQFLIDYTQRQCETYGVPLTNGVPVEHVFDYEQMDWVDGYYDLPRNPMTGRAVLLVPRRIVRALPWINFEDYLKMEFALFLRSKRVRGRKSKQNVEKMPPKEEIIQVTRREVERIDRYVDRKEKDRVNAQPKDLVESSEVIAEAARLIDELRKIPTGTKGAYLYQDLTLEILNFLFNPDLIEGRKQVRTEEGTEIRDILFTNDSDKPFWDYARNSHGSLTVVFECKNVDSVENPDVDQLGGYLGDALGYFGILLSRCPIADVRRKKFVSTYNKGTPHKVLLHLSDEDLIRMLEIRASGGDPTQIVRYKYQEFLSSVQ